MRAAKNSLSRQRESESRDMYMVQKKKDQTKKGNGYISSSIFKPSSSDTGDAEADVENYLEQLGRYDDEPEITSKPQLKHHATQKQLKLKQFRLKEQEGYQAGGKFMHKRAKQGQAVAMRTGPYKKTFVASASLPGIEKTDTLSNTPSNYRVRRLQGAKRLSPGNLHLTQSPPLSNYEGFPSKKRGSMQNDHKANILNDIGDSYRSPSWGGPNRGIPKIPNQIHRNKKMLPKSNSAYNSLPNLQVPGPNLDIRTQSDMVGNKTPSMENAQHGAKPAFKKMLIDQNTLPNSNLSQSEINKINDLHNQVLNQQLAQQLRLSQHMTEGTAFRETHTSTVKINKPPLILNNQLKQRRRQIRNQESLENAAMSQHAYGYNLLPSLASNKGMRGDAAMYDTPVSGLEDNQQLAPLPYAFVPMEQPIMMVNYPPRAPIHLQPPHRIQPMGYVDPHGAENLYYQVVAQPQETKPRRPAVYNRSLNAVENWAWFTQRLVELEQARAGPVKQRGYVESMEFDIDDDNALVLDHDYDEESDVYQRRVMPQKGQGRYKRGGNLRVLQRWRRLTQKLLQEAGGQDGWGGLQQVLTHNKQQPTDKQSNATENWKRLLLRMVEPNSGLSLKLLGRPDLLKLYKDREEKYLKVEVYRRWNILIRKALQRVASVGAQSNIERWSRLLKKADQRGHIQLGSAFKKVSGAMVRNRQMLIYAKWYRLAKALLKGAKESELRTLGKWRRLINGLKEQNIQYDERTRKLRIYAKWRKLATIMVTKEDKVRSMQVLGRWRRLIRNWQSSDAKMRKLKINAKWRLLAIKMLQKEKKLTHLRASGNWRKLYLALKRYEYDLYRERRNRKLEVNAAWAKMARQLLQRQRKPARLRAIGRWRVLYLGLKTADFGEQRERKQKRLAVTAAWSRLARRLVQRENKMQSLRVIGRWRKLYLGLKTEDFRELKDVRQKRMRVTAKWRVLAQKLLKREKKIFGAQIMEVYATWNKWARLLLQRHYKLRSLGYVSKWQRFAKLLLNKDKNQRSFRALKRWKILLKGLARRRGSDLNLLSLQNVSVGQQIEKLESRKAKLGTMKVWGNWNTLIKGVLLQENMHFAREEKIHRTLLLGKWRHLSRRLVRRHEVGQRWVTLIRGLYAQNGEFGLNFLHTFSTATVIKRLGAKQEKLAKLEVTRRWANLVRKMLRQHDGGQRGLRARVNLRRLAVKLLRRESRQQQPALKKWRFIAEQVLVLVRNEKQSANWDGAAAKLGAITADPAKKQRHLEIMGKWGKLSRKLVMKHDGRASMQASANLSRLARKLLAREERERRLRAFRRLRNLSMKLVVLEAQKSSSRAHLNLARLARLLVQKETGHYKRARPDHWRKMYQQLHHQKIAAVMARHNRRPHKRTVHLGGTERWELLAAYLITKRRQEKSERYHQKWGNFARKLLARSDAY